MRFLPGTSTDSTISHGPFFADRRVQQESRCERCKRFLWDSEKRTFCNRTCTNWFILLVFYAIFMGILFGMFYLCLFISTMYINKYHADAPQINKLYLTEGASPGLSALPNIIEKVELPLIWYPGPEAKANHYSDYLKDYFKVYERAKNDRKYVICDEQHPKPPGKLCLFDTNTMGPCGKPDYGYPEIKPCLYLKLNKLQGWEPEYYVDDNLPNEMPSELQDAIAAHKGSRRYLWVHCQPNIPFDAQHIGNISYYPKRAFYGDYFPYEGEKDYLAPLIAVQMDRHDSRYFINIYCTLWVKNAQQKGPMGGKVRAEVNFYIDLK